MRGALCFIILSSVSSFRVLITFHNASLVPMHSTPNNATTLKQYGRRLLLKFDDQPPDVTQLTTHFGGPANVHLVEYDLTVATSSLSSWNLNQSEPFALHIESLRSKTNGSGVVAVLDSGLAKIAESHFDPIEGYDFTTVREPFRNPDYTDAGGDCPSAWHGTKVISVLRQIAPGSGLTVFKVLDECGNGFASDIADAIVWAVGGRINGLEDNAFPADVVSMSFSGIGACPSYLQSAVNQARAAGVSVVAAAGNQASNASYFFPGNCQGVITVGAGGKDGIMEAYSNWGDSVTFIAPGGDERNPIAVLSPSGGDLDWSFDFGTSFAVPHVVGLMCLSGEFVSHDSLAAYLPIWQRTARGNFTLSSINSSNMAVAAATSVCPYGYDTTAPFDRYGGNMDYSVSCNSGFHVCQLMVWMCPSDKPLTAYIGRVYVFCCDMVGNSYSLNFGPTNCMSFQLSVPSPQSTGFQAWTSNAYGFAIQSGGATVASFGTYSGWQTCSGQETIVGFHGWFGAGLDQANIYCRRFCACAPDMYNLQGTCRCLPGTYYSYEGRCVPCGSCNAGQYLSGCSIVNPGSCVACTSLPSNNYFTGSGGLSDSCPYSPCVSCSTGYALQNCGGTSIGNCVPCPSIPAGYYFPTAGSCTYVQCASPPAGYYFASAGSCAYVKCAAAPLGYYFTTAGSCAYAQCSAPPTRYYFPTAGSCTTAACPPPYCCCGNYNTCGGTDPGSCKPCTNAGKYDYYDYTQTSAVSATTCVLGIVPAGSYRSLTDPRLKYSSVWYLPCAAGTYAPGTGTTACLVCPSSTVSLAGASTCTPCAPGTYASSTTTCANCPAGSYSYFQGATACQACPFGSGSSAGASVCVSCSSSATCKIGSTQRPCVACANACTQCPTGKFNNGSSPLCASCDPGKYSAALQATSSDTCAPCESGFTTSPTATGQSACVSCALQYQPMPINAKHVVPAPDPLLCSWECITSGYIRISYSTSSFAASAYSGYTATQALQLFHILRDYCCDPTILSGPGKFLSGCSRTANGVEASCSAIADGYFVPSPTPKLNYCLDFACNEWYVSTGTACIAQPSCGANYTFQRDTSGNIITTASGLFACVPCSQCMNGAGVLAQCNKTADTRCALCPPNTYSFNGSGCLSSVPLGYMGVVVQLTTVPAFQGRADVMADGVTPIKWGNLLVYTFTPCQTIPGSFMYTGQDVPCRRLDTQPALCQLPSCSTQCKPWNGTAGWFMLRGQCTPCQYDSFCSPTQYSDMSVCGPVLSPACTPCPLVPLPNSVGWANPGRYVSQAKYPCAVICKDGFVLDANSSCVFCPNLPNNSKIKTGCDWECSLGFTQLGASQCVPCEGVPTSCSLGYYLGYGVGQCAYCLPCTNTVANSRYISSGAANGPNSCGLLCNPGYFADPAFGFDVFNNPVTCTRCTPPQCVKGVSFAVQCTYTADAFCERCSSCPVGFAVSRPCSLGANTTCVQCDSTGLPSGAVWTASGCHEWDCQADFYRVADQCVPCRKPADCVISDSYSYVPSKPGCGVCTPCNASLLLPFQCFNGDGQCGVTYWCGWTSSSSIPTHTTTTVSLPVTPAPPSTTPPAPIQNYATLMTVTLSQANAAMLSNFSNYISCLQCSSIHILSITRGNVTTYCSATGCGSRRLLSEEVTIEVGMVSQAPLDATPPKVPAGSAVTLSASHPVPDEVDLSSPQQFNVFIKSVASTQVQSLSSKMWILLYIIAALIAAVGLVVLCCGFQYRRMLRRNNNKPAWHPLVVPMVRQN